MSAVARAGSTPLTEGCLAGFADASVLVRGLRHVNRRPVTPWMTRRRAMVGSRRAPLSVSRRFSCTKVLSGRRAAVSHLSDAQTRGSVRDGVR